MKTTSLKRMLCVLFAIAAVLSMALPAMAAGSGLSDVKYFLKQGTTVFVEGQTYVNEMNQPEGAYKIKDNMFSAPARGYQFVCWSRIGTGRIYGNIDRSAIPNYSTKLDYYAPGYQIELKGCTGYTFWGVWNCTREVKYYIYDGNFARANGLDPYAVYNKSNYLFETLFYGQDYAIKPNSARPDGTGFKTVKPDWEFVCWSRSGSGKIFGGVDPSAIPNYSTKLDYYAPGYVVRLNQSYTFYGIWSCKRDVIYYANIPGESNYNPGNYLMESAWYGTVKEVGANPFTYAGHEFVCWARSGSGRIYGNIDPSAIPGYSTTLDYYAPGCELVMNQAYTFWAVWADLAPAADVTP